MKGLCEARYADLCRCELWEGHGPIHLGAGGRVAWNDKGAVITEDTEE